MANFVVFPARRPGRFVAVNANYIQRIEAYGGDTVVTFGCGKRAVYSLPITEALSRIGDSLRNKYDATAKGEVRRG